MLHERDDIESGLYRAETKKYFSANKKCTPHRTSAAKENREIRQRIQHLLRHGHPSAVGKNNKSFFAVLMLDFRKETFGFRLDLITTEKQRQKAVVVSVL